MDFSRIKSLVQKNGDKFIFLEGGEPEMVILSFAEYEKLVGNSLYYRRDAAETDRSGGYRATAAHTPLVDSADFADATSPETELLIADQDGGDLPPSRPEEIRLEDLPV